MPPGRENHTDEQRNLMDASTTKLDSTQLALSRTWLANERTLMAWVRTAASQISFAFTIYKFFQYENGHQPNVQKGLFTPRYFAIILASIGLLSLFMATIQHRKEIRRLTPQMTEPPRSLAGLMSWLISIFGILVWVSTVIRQ